MAYVTVPKDLTHVKSKVLFGLTKRQVIPSRPCIGCGRCYIACYDAGHQALGFDAEARKPVFLGSKCVGCHLCATVCPVNCISKAKRVAKKH